MRGKRTNGAQIDLGLAIISALLIPGECLTQADIACFCGCTRQRIEQIESGALRKIRVRLQKTADRDPLWNELMDEMFNRRSAAEKTLKRGA